MVKPQIFVRLPPQLLEKLNDYAQQSGTFKTDVIIGALAQYLECAEALSPNQKIAELEARMTTVEALVKVR